MKNYSVSVILAVKNRKSFLNRALYSWSIQIYPDYELIIVDDNSEEDLRVAVWNWNKKIKNLHYHKISSSSDRTPATAWNFGYCQSQGEFVIFTGADLILSSEYMIQHMINSYVGRRVSVQNLFLSRLNTWMLHFIDWKSNPRAIESLPGFWKYRYWPDIDNRGLKIHWEANITTYLTGQRRCDWEWLGLFREDDTQYTADQDIYLREQVLHRTATTVKDVCTYHQWHKRPKIRVGRSRVYENELQARLIDRANYEGEK